MTETVVPEVMELLTEYPQLRWIHVPDSRLLYGTKGFPDFLIIGRRPLFRECKSWRGRLRPDQYAWKHLLLAAGQDYAVWRPQQLADGTIERELKGIA